ncbi:piwi protein (plasmid) [Mesomycoplasma conjunctivae]|nr:piwi protein [Mesomycoplasma conjunctivae]
MEKKGKGKIMHEIKNNKFDEILLSEESNKK